MLGNADRPIEEVVRFLSNMGIESGYLVPTETGLKKSIMDAHEQLRDFLKREGLHNFALQSQGQEAKVSIKTWLVKHDDLVETSTSLYRPESKSGDPRIWISGLAKYANAGNLLAVLVVNGELYVVNTSIHKLLESGYDQTTPLGKVLTRIIAKHNKPSTELLSKLIEISAHGFVPSLRSGPTGVGMTLETMLGISANSSKTPDYKGIEIKASRVAKSGKSQNRITLFSQVPDWKNSRIKDAATLLQTYGYDREGRRQLYCSMSDKPNTQGLFLAVDDTDLHSKHRTIHTDTNVVQWPLDSLRSALEEKHQETFWVKAKVDKTSGNERFHYVSVTHTRAPMISNFSALLQLGNVEVDFALHLLERAEGQKPRARDHGYLFKLNPRYLNLLFPPSQNYSLC